MSNSIPREGLECVRFEPSGEKLFVARGTSLQSAISRIGLPLSSSCDGDFLCGFCRVRVVEGLDNLSAAEAKELGVLKAMGAGPDERLACQARLTGPIAITADYW